MVGAVVVVVDVDVDVLAGCVVDVGAVLVVGVVVVVTSVVVVAASVVVVGEPAPVSVAGPITNPAPPSSDAAATPHADSRLTRRLSPKTARLWPRPPRDGGEPIRITTPDGAQDEASGLHGARTQRTVQPKSDDSAKLDPKDNATVPYIALDF